MIEIYPQLPRTGEPCLTGNVGFTFDQLPHLTRSDGITYAMATAAVACARQLDGNPRRRVDCQGCRRPFRPPLPRIPLYGGTPGFSHSSARITRCSISSERGDSHSRHSGARRRAGRREPRRTVFSRKKSVRAVAMAISRSGTPRAIVTRIGRLVPSRPIGRRAVGWCDEVYAIRGGIALRVTGAARQKEARDAGQQHSGSPGAGDPGDAVVERHEHADIEDQIAETVFTVSTLVARMITTMARPEEMIVPTHVSSSSCGSSRQPSERRRRGTSSKSAGSMQQRSSECGNRRREHREHHEIGYRRA